LSNGPASPAPAPYLDANQRTVGTRVEMTHTAATPIGMNVIAEVELVSTNGRTLRFKVACRDDKEPIGDGFHERTVIDRARVYGAAGEEEHRLNRSLILISSLGIFDSQLGAGCGAKRATALTSRQSISC